MENRKYKVIGKFKCNGEEYITVRFRNAATSMKKSEWMKIRKAVNYS